MCSWFVMVVFSVIVMGVDRFGLDNLGLDNDMFIIGMVKLVILVFSVESFV